MKPKEQSVGCSFLNIMINKIKNLISEKSNAVIAIDGCCASGKTTLAEKIAEEIGAQVIHTDDFFLLVEMRTPERLAMPGGNIHYERFVDEVINGIKSGKPFEHRIFNCKTGNYGGTKTVDPKKLVIIEGAYSLRPEFADIYDYKIFMTVDEKIQLDRILKRNGKDALEIFKSKWIPLENRYFEYFNIAEQCNIIIKNNEVNL